MSFPTSLSNVADNTDDILAAHINNIEAAIGITGSAVTTSINYRLGDVTSGHKVWRVGDVKMSFNGDGYGFLKCDGRSVGNTGSGADLASADYEDLFTFLTGTLGYSSTDTWGAGGTVNLPDWDNRVPIGGSGSYSLGATGGSSTIDLSHSHTINNHVHAGPSHTHGNGSLDVSGTTGSAGNHQHLMGLGWGNEHLYSMNNGSDTPRYGDTTYSSVRNGFASGVFSNRTGDAREAKTENTGSHSHSFSSNVGGSTASGGTGNTGNPSDRGMDSKLSASQSVVQPWLACYFLVKY